VKPIATVADLIAALGGYSRASELLGVSVSWIQNCAAVGRLPVRHEKAIRAVLEGREISDHLFHRRGRFTRP
jgi:hypothetical protein